METPGFELQVGPDYHYVQCARHLEGRIRSGEFAPGSRLPGEIALKDEYIVSLSTVRSAMRLLRERGLVLTRAPIGTFVAAELPPENDGGTR